MNFVPLILTLWIGGNLTLIAVVLVAAYLRRSEPLPVLES